MGSDGDVVGRSTRGLPGLPSGFFLLLQVPAVCLPLLQYYCYCTTPSTTNKTNQTTALTSKLQRFSWKNLVGKKTIQIYRF